MNFWLLFTILYLALAIFTAFPILKIAMRGVELHPGGASFDEANNFSPEAKESLKQNYSRMRGTLGF